MPKGKKVILFSILVLSLLGCLMIYWESERPVSQCLPEGECYRVEIHGIFFEEYLVYSSEEDTLPRLLSAMEDQAVSRGPKFETLDGDGYLLWLYIEGVNGPITVTVRQDGRMNISEMGSDPRCYEGASDLFQNIQTITKELSAENLRKE